MNTMPANLQTILITPRSSEPKAFTFTLDAREQKTWFVLIAGVTGHYTITLQLQGCAANANLVVMPLLWDKQQLSLTILQEHYASESTSSVQVVGASAHQSHVTVHGKTIVNNNLQQIKAHQKSSFLLLSSSAKVQVQPALMSLSKGVVCSHGAAISSFDQEHVHYCAERGIASGNAKRLLLEGFLKQAWSDDSADNQRCEIEEHIDQAVRKMLT